MFSSSLFTVILRTRVRKIIQSLDGILFDNATGGSVARNETLTEINGKIEDLNNVVQTTKDQLVTELMIFQELYRIIVILCNVKSLFTRH